MGLTTGQGVALRATLALFMHWLVDVRLAEASFSSPLAGVVAGILLAVFLLGAVVGSLTILPAERFPLLLRPLADYCARRPYSALASCTAVYLVACHATGVAAAMFNPDIRIVTAVKYLRIVGIIGAVVSRNGFRPKKAWTLVVVGGAPLLLQPIALLEPTTWEARNRSTFLAFFAMEVVGCTLSLGLSLAGSYAARAASRAARTVQSTLIDKAARAQSLLETAMPPVIARELLAGTPAYELSRSFESATVAFVSLEDFADFEAAGDPRALVAWLNAVYAAFDGLVDAYGERVNKIEVVANTYIVAGGIPIENPLHCVLTACFCIDLLDLCENVPGVGRVRVKIGINSGPVAAGLIGSTRRFFRIVGDTVNVASRMMSTGELGRIQCSPSAVACMRSNGIELHGLLLQPRGDVDVKGKGKLCTSWLQRPVSPPNDDQQSVLQGLPETAELPSFTDPPPVSVGGSLTDVAIAMDRVLPANSSAVAAVAATMPPLDRVRREEFSSLKISAVDSRDRLPEPQPVEASSSGRPPLPLRTKMRRSRRFSPPELYAVSPPAPPGSLLTPEVTGIRVNSHASPRDRLPCTRLPASSSTHALPPMRDVLAIGGTSHHPPAHPPVRSIPHAPRELARFHELFGREAGVSGLTISLPPLEMQTVRAPSTPTAGVVSPTAGGSPVALEPGAVRAMRSSLGHGVVHRVQSFLPGSIDPTHYGVIRAPSVNPGSPIARRLDGRTLLQRGAQLDAEHRASALFAGRSKLPSAPPAVVGGGGLWRHEDAAESARYAPLSVRTTRIEAGPGLQLQSTPVELDSSPCVVDVTPIPSSNQAALPSTPAVSSPAPSPISLSPQNCSEAVRTMTDGAPHAILDGLQRPWHGIIAADPTSVEQRIAHSRGVLYLKASGGIRRGAAMRRDVSHEDYIPDTGSDRMSVSGTVLSANDADMRRERPGLRSPPEKRSAIDAGPLASSPTTTMSTRGGLLSAALARASRSVRTRPSTPSTKQPEQTETVATASPAPVTLPTPALEPGTAGSVEPPQTADESRIDDVASVRSPPPLRHPGVAALPSFSLTSVVAHAAPFTFSDPVSEAAMVTALGRSMAMNATMWFLVILAGFVGINAIFFIASAASVIHIGIAVPSTVFAACCVFVSWRSGVAQIPESYGRFRLWTITLLISIVYAFEVLNFVTFNVPDGPHERREEILMWSVLWLSLSGTSVAVSRIPFVQALAFGLVSSTMDLAYVLAQGLILRLSPDVPLIAFAHLVIFRAALVWASHAYESGERDDYAVQCAIGAAESDANSLLGNLFPAPIVACLTQGKPVPPPQISRDTAILYADVAGFTRISSGLSSADLMGVLNEMYARFDGLVEEAGLWKVETVGDAYIVVGGLASFSALEPPPDPPSASAARIHLDRIFHLAVKMLDELAAMRVQFGLPLHMRIGVHCGDVVTGVIGSQRPRFCVLGHAVTVAEHVEGTGALDRVTCTEEAHRRYLASSFEFMDATPVAPAAGDHVQLHSRGRFHVSLAGRRSDARGPPIDVQQ